MRLALILPFAALLHAAPCTSTARCTEWITLGGGPARSLIYRTYPLETRNENITQALVVVHGAGRDADNYFRTALAAAFLADALQDTVVISPRFASNDGGCRDQLAPNEVSWSCNGDSWRSGGLAPGTRLTSYDFADEILRKLARKGIFPNLRSIVVAGHSAGGQFATRYEMANRLHDSLGIPITYVVANPSSYAWPDETRPGQDAQRQKCPGYDHWPYGLADRTGYAAATPDDQLRKQLAARPVTYLLGELDTLPLAGFDSSCPAMVQGPTRRARGEDFSAYINRKYGAQHKTVVIPLCGHNARCMFTADPALAVLFPR
jgi:pimeloyl-ACP methyl ester carboxylesterase